MLHATNVCQIHVQSSRFPKPPQQKDTFHVNKQTDYVGRWITGHHKHCLYVVFNDKVTSGRHVFPVLTAMALTDHAARVPVGCHTCFRVLLVIASFT